MPNFDGSRPKKIFSPTVNSLTNESSWKMIATPAFSARGFETAI
jgi:hypothetical protein